MPPITKVLRDISYSLTPIATVFLAMLLSMLPYGFSTFGPIKPALSYVVIYYWLIFTMPMIPLFGLFLAGICLDALSGDPMGMNVVAFYLFYLLSMQQSRYMQAKPFHVLWAGFAITLCVVLVAKAMLYNIFVGQISIIPILFNVLLTIAIYPLISILLSRLTWVYMED